MKKQTLIFLLIMFFGLSLLTSCGGGGDDGPGIAFAGKTFVKDGGTTFVLNGNDVTDLVTNFTLTINSNADGGSLAITTAEGAENGTVTNVTINSITTSGLASWGNLSNVVYADGKLSFSISSTSTKVGNGTVVVTNLDEQ